ncbi:uncharacterized protein FYW61_008792 [Anableps anableps]
MSDSLMRGVRVQLTTTMDCVLRTAVFEVMRVLESALYNHKMEMAQKGEEIAQLKVKLQTAELKLKDFVSQRGAETTKTQTNPEVVPVVPGQSVTVPEIDVEVPDDWCAPLGYDTATKQEEGFCPSVRLRQFSIRLSPVPLVKHKDNRVINLQRSPVGRRAKRLSVMKKPKQTQDTDLRVANRASRQPKPSGDLNKLLKDLRQDYCNLTGLDRLRKRQSIEETFSDDNGTEKEDKDSSKQKEENKSRDAYTCETCNRVFSTKQGLCVHLRSQKKCKGCLMVFCFQGAANYHSRVCSKYKALTKKSSSQAILEKGNALNSSKTQVRKKESMQSSTDDGKTSTRKFSCEQCSFNTNFVKKFKRHILSHNMKVLTCKICLERFDEKKSLDVHTRKHKNGDVGWTKPLEDVDEDRGFKHAQ